MQFLIIRLLLVKKEPLLIFLEYEVGCIDYIFTITLLQGDYVLKYYNDNAIIKKKYKRLKNKIF